MDGVRRACGSAAWQRIGWRDYRLEFALDELIYRIKRATERPDLRLPVRFGEVPAGVAENAKGVMTATRSVKLRSATRCIFLVDGDVDLVEAADCLILTTGKANVQYGRQNIILAGGIIEGTEDMPPHDNQTRLSIRISGTSISVSNSSNLILSCAGGRRGVLDPQLRVPQFTVPDAQLPERLLGMHDRLGRSPPPVSARVREPELAA